MHYRSIALAAMLVLAWTETSHAATFFVATNGNDGNSGSQMQPFLTLGKAQSVAAAGDTVFIRGGTYRIRSSTASDGVLLNKSGTSSARIKYWAFQSEKPVFDFSGMTAQARIKGFNVTASWIHLKGIAVQKVPQNLTTEHESWGIYNDGGSNNIYELLDLHHNMGPGLFIIRGANNLVLNCDSHHNFDPNSSSGSGTNADGFGCHVNRAGDTGNVFRGCRAWWNSDDGFDLIQAQEVVVIENSWAWMNGYLPDSTTASGGDGNGFKAGGYGVPATHVPANPPSHIVRQSLGFLNRAAGFYQNHHPVSNKFYSNTAYNNKSSNYNCLGLNGNVGILRNNLAHVGTAIANGSGADTAFNSWTLSVTVSDADFVSVSTSGVDGARAADGTLPNLNFMKLKSGSDLIDKGTNVGLPFKGSAPDLGAFEFSSTAAAAATTEPSLELSAGAAGAPAPAVDP